MLKSAKDKPKVGKSAIVSGSVERKGLSNITNLPQQPKSSTLDNKSQFISASTKEYINQLKKVYIMNYDTFLLQILFCICFSLTSLSNILVQENMMLLNLLAERKYPFMFNLICFVWGIPLGINRHTLFSYWLFN